MSKKYFTPKDEVIFDEFYNSEHLPLDLEQVLYTSLKASVNHGYEIDDDPIVRGLINSIFIKVAGIVLEEEPGYEDDFDMYEENCQQIELNSEWAEELFESFKGRFESNMKRHPDIDWEKVEKSIKSDDKILMSVLEMERHGHKPDVYNMDEEGFDIGSCVEDSRARYLSGVADVYDRMAADTLDSLNRYRYGSVIAGAAKEFASKIGVKFLSPEQYKQLARFGDMDKISRCWIETPIEERLQEKVRFGLEFWGKPDVRTGMSPLYDHWNVHWRGTLRVKWVDK